MTVALIILLTVMLVSYLAFAYRYWRFSPWNATWQGITLQSQKLTMGALAAFFLADTIVPGEWPGRSVLLIGLLLLLAGEAVATLAGLVHVQRKHRPVTRRQGTGYVPLEDIERTNPPRRSS